jgi:hypothetical protein
MNPNELKAPTTWDKVKDGVFRIALTYTIILWAGVPWKEALIYTFAIAAVLIGLFYATSR